MSVNIDEKGVVTFSTLTMKRSILEQVEIKEIKDLHDQGGKLLGYTSEFWFLYSTEDGSKIFCMRSNDVQTLMWQQLTKQYTADEYRTKYTEINTEFKSRWAALQAKTPQIFIA